MSNASGKFVLRIHPELHQLLREASEEQHVSLNQFCTAQLSRAFGKDINRTERIAYGVPIDTLQSLLRDAGLPVIGCILFGSVGRGTQTENSDIDLLLVLPTKQLPERSFYHKWDAIIGPALKQLVPREVSPQFAALPETPLSGGSLWFEAALEGIVFWEPRQEISSCLIAIREAMAEGKLVRQISHGHPFWVRTEHEK